MTPKPNLQKLLLGHLPDSALSQESDGDVRSLMLQMLDVRPLDVKLTEQPKPQAPAPPTEAPESRPAQVTGTPSHFSTLIPGMISLKGQILVELHTDIAKLLKLNISRKEAIATYLDQLARHSPAPSLASGASDPAGGLRRWLEGPRSPAQNAALQMYFEELAVLTLGQAILLKTWSDRGIRSFTETDLGRMNWAVSTALKPHVPFDRDGWQLTRPNIYSWYHPNQAIQSELWTTLASGQLAEDGPSLLAALLGLARQHHSDRVDQQGYDPRFFRALWDATSAIAPEPAQAGLIKREKIFFSPTLREGSLVRSGPSSVSWIGMESSPFQLMIAELQQLFRGPGQPPLWAIGSGLEAQLRDQLSLTLSSPKPSLITRITEIEACDAAVVLEERTVRAQGRTHESARLREQLEQYPVLKKLRGPLSSLGALQTCVALGKLRPGGLLWWAREEPLSADEGNELLGHLLEKGKLVCHWDFSSLEHSLPSSVPLFPRHLYLFAREPRLEERLSHRPLSVVLRGQIRSHVEIPLVLGDALAATHRTVQPRGHWQVHAQKSPTCQKDWAERWPDPADLGKLHAIERLRSCSVPLAAFATIRLVPESTASNGIDPGWSIPEPLAGIWLRLEHGEDGRKLSPRPLPRPGREARGSGFLILLPSEAWCAPLSAYLRLLIVRDWVDQNAERKSDRWILNEQVVRFIPVPKTLVSRLEKNDASSTCGSDWANRLRDLASRPKEILESLEKSQDPAVHLEAFVQGARVLSTLDSGQSRLLGVVASDGAVRWGKLLEILPSTECLAMSMHPRVLISGNLPPHVPVARVERVKTPQPGILLATELGPFMRIASDQPLLLDMLWEQMKDISHHTWSEIVRGIRLPRRLEVAEATAADLLRLHSEQTQRLKELSQLLSACQLF